jgi:hypothetical protein
VCGGGGSWGGRDVCVLCGVEGGEVRGREGESVEGMERERCGRGEHVLTLVASGGMH